MTTLDPVPREVFVVRVLRESVPIHFDPIARLPLPRAFQVASHDRTSARERGEPVHLSVYDLSRTTSAEVIDARQKGREFFEPMAAFRLKVADVEDLDQHYPLRVARFERPEQGAVGLAHAGIVGLDKSQRPTDSIEAVSRQLCGCCELVTGKSTPSLQTG